MNIIAKALTSLYKSLIDYFAVLCYELLHVSSFKHRKILFLDFDGVLATDNYYDKLCFANLKTKDSWGRFFDPICCNYLQDVVSKTDASLVITSSWRNYLSCFQLILMWNLRGLPGKIIGITPKYSIHRGIEINAWLSHHKDVSNYVIIDDMDYLQFEAEHHSHLVTCDHFKGLQIDTCLKAIEILNRH